MISILFQILIQAAFAPAGSSTDRGCQAQDSDCYNLDESWVDNVMSVMSQHLGANITAPSTIMYGSDCSGIDAPYWALEKLVGKLDRVPCLCCCFPIMN